MDTNEHNHKKQTLEERVARLEEHVFRSPGFARSTTTDIYRDGNQHFPNPSGRTQEKDKGVIPGTVYSF